MTPKDEKRLQDIEARWLASCAGKWGTEQTRKEDMPWLIRQLRETDAMLHGKGAGEETPPQ